MSIPDTVFLIPVAGIAHALSFYDFAADTMDMSTRQLRISDAHQIRQQISRFVGKKINIILNNGTAIVGVLKSSNDQEIEMQNMARRTQRYPLSTITEIYFDSLV